MEGESAAGAASISWFTLFLAWFVVGLAVGLGLKLAEAVFKIDLGSSRIFKAIAPKPKEEPQPEPEQNQNNGSVKWPQQEATT